MLLRAVASTSRAKSKGAHEGAGIDVSIDGEGATDRKSTRNTGDHAVLGNPPSSRLRPRIEPRLRPRLGAATVKVTGASAAERQAQSGVATPRPTYPQGRYASVSALQDSPRGEAGEAPDPGMAGVVRGRTQSACTPCGWHLACRMTTTSCSKTPPAWAMPGRSQAGCRPKRRAMARPSAGSTRPTPYPGSKTALLPGIQCH